MNKILYILILFSCTHFNNRYDNNLRGVKDINVVRFNKEVDNLNYPQALREFTYRFIEKKGNLPDTVKIYDIIIYNKYNEKEYNIRQLQDEFNSIEECKFDYLNYRVNYVYRNILNTSELAWKEVIIYFGRVGDEKINIYNDKVNCFDNIGFAFHYENNVYHFVGVDSPVQ